MKKHIAPYIILCLIITYVSNFSFAQNTNLPDPDDTTDARYPAYCATQSSVCGTAPEQFTYLMDFVREMMNAIKTIGPEWEYLGQYVNPNRFQWSVFVAPKKTVAGKLLRNIDQKLKFGLATTAIFASPVNFAGLKDMLWGVVLLSKNQVFLRDNKLIEQLETQLNDKKYELGLWGWWNEQIIPENIALMKQIISDYSGKLLLIPSSTIRVGVSYNNITSLLTQILSSAKNFLYFGTTAQLDSMSRWSYSQGIFVGFSPDSMATIKREYNCARWPYYICSSEKTKFKDAWSKMWKGIQLWSSETTKTFNDAVDRLWEIFSKEQSQSFKDREDDLLKSMYGTTKMSTWTLSDALKKSWAGIKKSGAEIGEEMVDLASDIETFRTFPEYIKGTVENIPPSLDIPPVTVFTTDITTHIDTYVYDVLNSQQTDLDLVSMVEVSWVTPAFAVLGQQLLAIKNNVLGDKEKDNSLIKSLQMASELQCER